MKAIGLEVKKVVWMEYDLEKNLDSFEVDLMDLNLEI